MPAPSINPLPPAPSRANPGQFPARGDAFLGALPALVTQINALITYWNAELDTTAFLNRINGGVIEGTVTFALPPILRGSATTGEQAVATFAKGTTQRQALRIANDGSLNLVPLNGAVAQLRINNQEVYHTGNLPSAGDVGAVPSGSYTAADVRAKLLTVDGAGSGVDADLLDGQHGDYYRAAANLTGTVPDARLPSNIVRNSRRVNSGDGLNGGAPLTGDVTLSVDSSVARRNQQNTFTEHPIFQSGAAYIQAPSASNAHLWFGTIGGALRGLIWAAGASNLMRYRSYNAAGDAYREFSHNADTGALSSSEFVGGGEGLVRLNASAMDRGTVADARLPGTAVRTSRTLTAGDGLNGGGNLNGDRSFAVDASVVRTGRQIVAGNGLTGGGNLGADRTISLGTPGTITADSANAVQSGSHTHAITAATVGELMSRLGIASIGTFAMLAVAGDGALSSGTVRAGSGLRYSAANGRVDHPGQFGASAPAGTWRLHGVASSYSSGDGRMASVWQRIS